MAISLMEAYMIEALKAHPYTYDEVVQHLQAGNIAVFQKNYSYDFTLLQQLFEQDETAFREAYTDRYTVKYVTIKGVTSLLRIKFGIKVEQYIELENGVNGLTVDEATEQEIRTMLSSNWTVTREGTQISILA